MWSSCWYKFTIITDEDFSDPDIRFKLLISISDLYKETGFKKGTHKHIREKDRVVNVLTGVAVDEVKHFSLTVSNGWIAYHLYTLYGSR